MLSTRHYDKIRKQVTLLAFAVVSNDETVATMQVTRPARLRTGMEKYTATLRLWRDTDGNRGYSDFSGNAGGCGYDKSAASMMAACRAAGLTSRNEWLTYRGIVKLIAESLQAEVYQIVRII